MHRIFTKVAIQEHQVFVSQSSVWMAGWYPFFWHSESGREKRPEAAVLCHFKEPLSHLAEMEQFDVFETQGPNWFRLNSIWFTLHTWHQWPVSGLEAVRGLSTSQGVCNLLEQSGKRFEQLKVRNALHVFVVLRIASQCFSPLPPYVLSQLLYFRIRSNIGKRIRIQFSHNCTSPKHWNSIKSFWFILPITLHPSSKQLRMFC